MIREYDKQVTSVKLRIGHREKLEQLAKITGQNRGQLINQAIDKLLQEYAEYDGSDY